MAESDNSNSSGERIRSERQPGRTSIVLMGSLSAAAACFDMLRANPRLDITAMVCRDDDPREPGERYAIDLARQHTVPVHTLETMPRADLGLAIRFDQVLRARHLARFERGVINLHGAPLPDMRGSMCECAAILEERAQFGASLHLMDEGVDTGPVLCVEHFDIAGDATAGALLREANTRGVNMVRDNLDAFIDGRLQPAAQDLACGRTYRSAQLEPVRDAPLPRDPAARDRVLRAFHYGPGPVRRGQGLRARLASVIPGWRS